MFVLISIKQTLIFFFVFSFYLNHSFFRLSFSWLADEAQEKGVGRLKVSLNLDGSGLGTAFDSLSFFSADFTILYYTILD